MSELRNGDEKNPYDVQIGFTANHIWNEQVERYLKTKVHSTFRMQFESYSITFFSSYCWKFGIHISDKKTLSIFDENNVQVLKIENLGDENFEDYMVDIEYLYEDMCFISVLCKDKLVGAIKLERQGESFKTSMFKCPEGFEWIDGNDQSQIYIATNDNKLLNYKFETLIEKFSHITQSSGRGVIVYEENEVLSHMAIEGRIGKAFYICRGESYADEKRYEVVFEDGDKTFVRTGKLSSATEEIKTYFNHTTLEYIVHCTGINGKDGLVIRVNENGYQVLPAEDLFHTSHSKYYYYISNERFEEFVKEVKENGDKLIPLAQWIEEEYWLQDDREKNRNKRLIKKF